MPNIRRALILLPLLLPAGCALSIGNPVADASSLLIPVAGVTAEQLRDSYLAPRSDGRTHNAIDIMAPRGTRVLAATDGTILKLHQGTVGGNSLYLLDRNGRTLYYYAHLDRYVDNLVEGQTVSRGEIIAYVGDTGNAGTGNYHLHFSVSHLADAHRWWEGVSTNPYPLLTRGARFPGRLGAR